MVHRKVWSILLLGLMLTAASAVMPGANNGGEPKITGTGVPGEGLTDFDDPVAMPMTGVRPLLVILLEFTDRAHDPVLTPAFVRNQIFGPRPSMNDFWLEQSYGQFSFSDQGNWAWVMAWDDPGTAATDESTLAYWATQPSPNFLQWALVSLDKAGFNFAPYDYDSDGTIHFGPEVSQLTVYANQIFFAGFMRGLPGGITLDGKAVMGAACGVSGGTPWITLYAHELAHEASYGGFHFLTDYYGIIPENIGGFTLMGFSGAGSDPNTRPLGPWHLDPFSKLKLGWYSGTAVSSDGFFDIPNAEASPTTFVLHDPAHGKDEYFMVENRWKGTSYDNSDQIGPLPAPFDIAGSAIDIADEGLLVWHVDETRDWNGSTTGGYAKVDLIRRGGSDNNAAFDGSDGAYYDFWDGSAPESAKWNGGANSRTGVWCVSPAGLTMRAWLDVPGPGVLICTEPLETSAVPGSAGTITVPLRNTGDVADTFLISVVGPPDVAATPPAPIAIGPKAVASVDVLLTPVRACTTAPGPRTVTITATSIVNPAVTSSVDATLNVLPFGEPEASVAAADNDVEPGELGTFNVGLTNHGNALDTITLTFTGIDFGTAYLADPTAIPASWVSFAPPNPSAPACGSTGSVLTITVPMDWAAMEDATYEFVITGTSALTPSASDTATGQLVVRATPLSMMLYVEKECEDLIDAVLALPPSDVRDGLYDKANSTCAKIRQGIDRYLMGDDPPASNHFETSKNKLNAFLHLLDAQRGKALTVAQADALEAMVQTILAHLDAILAAI